MEAEGILRHMIKNACISLKRLLVEIWILRGSLVRAQQEVRSTVKKASAILKNTYVKNTYGPNVGRNMNVNSDSGEIADENEEHMGNCKKDDLCSKVTKKLTELWSTIGWKTEILSDEPGYLAEMSKKSVFCCCF